MFCKFGDRPNIGISEVVEKDFYSESLTLWMMKIFCGYYESCHSFHTGGTSYSSSPQCSSRFMTNHFLNKCLCVRVSVCPCVRVS
ncbi:unnamed protein product, partial [Nesidiocoris tenuis]